MGFASVDDIDHLQVSRVHHVEMPSSGRSGSGCRFDAGKAEKPFSWRFTPQDAASWGWVASELLPPAVSVSASDPCCVLSSPLRLEL